MIACLLGNGRPGSDDGSHQPDWIVGLIVVSSAMLKMFAIAALLISASAAQAEDKPDPKLETWVTCLSTKAGQYGKMDVAADVAAKAAMGACKPEETNYFTPSKVSFAEAMIEGKYGAELRKREQTDARRAQVVPDMEAFVLSKILEARIAPKP